jgi:Ankyrin repeats (3 copies)/Ankyrin repeats (many copies)
MNLLSSDTFKQNYVNYVRTRHPTAISYYLAKFPLSYLTNARLTWMLKRISTSPPNWYNDDLGTHGTPLAGAVLRNDVEMINFLIDAGADVDKPFDHHRWYSGMTPLYLAANHGYQEAFDALLDRGADPRKPHTFSQCTVLHESCYHGQIRKVKRLLELGVDLNCKNQQGLTPLHVAIQLGAVKLLVETGAEVLHDTSSSSSSGFVKTAVHYSIELQDEAITEYLLEQCEDLGHLENINLEQIRWAEGKPWFARLRQVIGSEREGLDGGSARVLSAEDVMRAKCILQERLMLPSTVTANILDYAEYWVRSAGRRTELVVVDESTPEHPYVQVCVPGWGGASPVRQVVFRTRSHDQGKSMSQFPYV